MPLNSMVANAKITGENVSYLMTTSKCVIGRNSTSRVEVRVGENTCVSRQHLKITSKGNNLYMKCLGKNGIFINECFFVYNLEDVLMPSIFKIRFPSTNIVLQVESRGYLIENFKKQYPLKKRLVIMPEEMESCILESEENYLSESSGENSSLISRRMIIHNENSNDRLSPTDHGSDTIKPPYSYAQLIIQAIVSTDNKQMTLSDIYRFISKMFPFYKMSHKGWQNSIRHNLSLNRYFIRVPRSQNNCTKSAYWRIDEPQREHLTKQAFWKRRSKNFCMYHTKSTDQKSNIKFECKSDIDISYNKNSVSERMEDNTSKHVFQEEMSSSNDIKSKPLLSIVQSDDEREMLPTIDRTSIKTISFVNDYQDMMDNELGQTYDF